MLEGVSVLQPSVQRSVPRKTHAKGGPAYPIDSEPQCEEGTLVGSRELIWLNGNQCE